MGRRLRSLIGLALLALSLLLGVYGLSAVLYRGDSGGNGDTYVTLGAIKSTHNLPEPSRYLLPPSRSSLPG